MKNKVWGALIWCLLLNSIIIASFSVLHGSPSEYAQSYFKSDQFDFDYEEFTREIGPVELANWSADELKRDIVIEPQDIKEYREQHDVMAEIQSTQKQYNREIERAIQNKDEITKQALMSERERKIGDIRNDLMDDKYVASQIRAEKEKKIDIYISNLNQRLNRLHDEYPYSYELTNIKTGKTVQYGNINDQAAYKKTYSKDKGYLTTQLLNSSMGDEWDKGFEQMNIDPAVFYKGTIIVPEKKLSEWQNYQDFQRQRTSFYVIIACGILSLVCLLFVYKFRKEWFQNHILHQAYRRLSIDIKLALWIFTIFLVLLVSVGTSSTVVNMSTNFNIFIELLFLLPLGTLLIYFGILQTVWLIEELKEGKNLREEWDTSAFMRAWRLLIVKPFQMLREAFSDSPIAFQVAIILFVLFMWGVGTSLVFTIPEMALVYIICVFMIGLPALFIIFYRIRYLNKLIVATSQIATGTLNDPVEVKGNSIFAKQATMLNQMKEGIHVSKKEQAKSERLKTELITNVSHDLRTPLTSIITYTDLLKNPDLTEEDRHHYVEVLDRKSQRLKTLIEDLFEVSKMASGNLELQKQRIDLTKLLQQALAEHQEQMEKASLSLKVTTPTEPLLAYVDGQKWWRVLDNLIVNASKYALEGTRVYVSLKKVGDVAEFVVKNVAKYELNEDAAELVERFKRADASRNTEGSGLGLAIAQSIVDLHGGEMNIEIDGDLFKVIVKVPLTI
ncbi:histidine kinase dimerization/phospho-acceptor domain-containing protein [Priestia koreensis]|uniref:histidine kinase dimerization/phospho-acceptor domain-containing protein n=1 Tax=Priestia koreensis TaxID=284581 RepID=UPI00345956D2